MLACEGIHISHCLDYEKNEDVRKNLPCTANPSRHVGHIESKQPIVVGCIARDAHAVSAASGSNIDVIDTHVDKPIVGVDVAVVGRCGLIDVVHVTSSRVSRLRQG